MCSDLVKMVKDLVPRNMFNFAQPYKMTKLLVGTLAEARLFFQGLLFHRSQTTFDEQKRQI